MRSRPKLVRIFAALAAASVFPMGAPASAQSQSAPLQGEVRKGDQAPLRLQRPMIPAPTGVQRAGVDTSSFDLNANANKPLQAVSAFDQWPGATPNELRISRPLIPLNAQQQPAVPLSATATPPPAPMNAEAEALAIISKYDVFVLLDQSGSMATADCFGLSRWQWCEQETRNFAATTGAVLQGIDLTLFCHVYRDFGMMKASQLHEVFVRNHPTGGTFLFGPIMHVIERMRWGYSHGYQRPILVAVITDGEPGDGEQVAELLVRFTKEVPNGLVKFVFLKVGENTPGDRLILEYDQDLMRNGAQYDMVEARSFDYLRAHGLLRTLVDCVKE
jgi:hypothetical protein